MPASTLTADLPLSKKPVNGAASGVSVAARPSLAASAAPVRRQRPILFTPGPVMLDDASCRDGVQQMVYHRTAEFSRCILNCEEMLKEACGAAAGDRVMMLTASGTAGMEAAVLNLFAPGDKVLVVNAGDFGHRFTEICELHGLNVSEVVLGPGQPLAAAALEPYEGKGFSGMLVNHHETSTGALLDMEIVSAFCRSNSLVLVVDAVGSFLADPVSMAASGIDALIFSSQKALALPPGLSFVALGARAQERVRAHRPRSYYFDFRKYLDDIARGQTPFTPAVGLIRQLESRLERVLVHGAASQVALVRSLALDFRAKVRGLPFRLLASSPSNAVTALEPINGAGPGHYVKVLAEEHGIFVCPNGGALRERVFRVGHLGDLSPADNTYLAAALREISERFRA